MKSIKSIVALFDTECKRVYATRSPRDYQQKFTSAKIFCQTHWPNLDQPSRVDAAEKFIQWFFAQKALTTRMPDSVASLAEYFSEYESWIKRNTFKSHESWNDAVKRDSRELAPVSLAMTPWDDYLANGHLEDLAL